MTPVDQTLFWTPEGNRGNCQQAATASILDLPLDEVPNFHDCEQGFWRGFKDFIQSRGYVVMALRNGDMDSWCRHSGAHYLAYGQSPRGVSHAVVYCRGVLAHDPHPSRAGILDVEEINVLVRA